MAVSTIAVSNIILHDKWPGTPIKVVPAEDKNGETFTNAAHHNVVTPEYRPGTKVIVYDSTSSGFATMIYLRWNLSPSGIAGAMSEIVVPEALVTALAYYDVTVDGDAIPTDVEAMGIPCAIMLSAMTDTYFGWFWCGGVVPIDWTPLLAATTVVTQATMLAGAAFSITDGDGDGDRPVFALTDANMSASGWSMADDT